MHATLDEKTLAAVLPGSWLVAATNFPMWLTGEHVEPRLGYQVVGEHPLVLSHDVSYLTADGDEKHIVGRDTWDHDGFRRRGKGLLGAFGGRWTVSGASADGTIVVIHLSKSLATPSGIDVLVREGAEVQEVRATVARATEEFGLSPEHFGSLSWLVGAPTR
jgi:hypothetical protein